QRRPHGQGGVAATSPTVSSGGDGVTLLRLSMGGSSDKYGWRLLITDVALSVGSIPFSADLPPQAMASRSAPQKTRGVSR
ncbi:Os06g0473700, partial [Oryza sativa Japonica Group]